jgi:Cu-Zn family superoxide dismutase
MSDGCKSMGAHYNPDNVNHGTLEEGHVGDLGNVQADENGKANFSIKASRVDLIGDRSVVGRGIVIHADEDDLGKGGDEESLKTGNAGDRLACGVITLRSTK